MKNPSSKFWIKVINSLSVFHNIALLVVVTVFVLLFWKDKHFQFFLLRHQSWSICNRCPFILIHSLFHISCWSTCFKEVYYWMITVVDSFWWCCLWSCLVGECVSFVLCSIWKRCHYCKARTFIYTVCWKLWMTLIWSRTNEVVVWPWTIYIIII